MWMGRFLAVIVLNLPLMLLLNLQIQPVAKNSLIAIILLIDLVCLGVLLRFHKKIIQALQQPSFLAQVKLQNRSIPSLDGANTFQIAEIKSIDGNHLPVKVDLSFSSVALPQLADDFSAQVFTKDQTPLLILNTERQILILVAGIRTDS